MGWKEIFGQSVKGALKPIEKELKKETRKVAKRVKAIKSDRALDEAARQISQTIWYGRHGNSLIETDGNIMTPDEYLAQFGISPRKAENMKSESKDLWTLRLKIESQLKNRP